MAKSSSASNQFALRKGDGVAIDVIPHQSVETAGITQITYGLNLNEAPVPTRRYVADVADAVSKHGGIHLVFGQEKVGSEDLRSLLVIHVSASSIRSILQSFAQMRPTFQKISDTVGRETEALCPVTEGSAQAVAFSATGCACAAAGEDACLDFYSVSPFSVRSLQVVKKVAVDPVVRVDLRVSLLAALIDKLTTLEKTLPGVKLENDYVGI